MKITWMGHADEPQVRTLPVALIQNENGVVSFKDTSGGVLLMVPVARLISAESEDA